MEDLVIYYIPAFIFLISILIFFHELGHYKVARWCGVRIEVFSLGFGKEIFGWTDKAGTRWKISILPLGGYVKMFGDADPSGMTRTAEVSSTLNREGQTGDADDAGDPDRTEMPRELTAEEKAVAFHFQPLWQRAAIVAAGPIANFVLAVLLFMVVLLAAGQSYTPAAVQAVVEGSAAAEAGLQPGDRFVEIDGRRIDRFEDIIQIVQMSPGHTLPVQIERDGRILSLDITPKKVSFEDSNGNSHDVGRLGVQGPQQAVREVGFAESFVLAIEETGNAVSVIFVSLDRIFSGTLSASELAGPIGIFDMAGTVVQQHGIIALLSLMAFLSVNLGLVNLFPVPVLDGGHLMFYAYEAVFGKAPTERVQDLSYRVGFALLIGLMLFVTWNDIVRKIGAGQG